MGDSYGQLAGVSAVLGGFAVSFLSVVLVLSDARRRVAAAVALSTLSAACFFLTALGWSLFSSQYAKVAASSGAARVTFETMLEAANRLQRPLSLLFVLGILLLMATLGSGGWMRSRRLGMFTTAVAALATVMALVIVAAFTH